VIDRAIELLNNRSRILVFTGAGMSTASGIPDFRGPDGVWTKVDPAEFTFQRYVDDGEVRRRSWAMRRDSGVLEAEPNRAHAAIVDLWRAGYLQACITQNIDGLHQKAGLPEDAVVEMHGTAHRSRCLGCDTSWPTTEIVRRVTTGDADPHCEHCGSIIKAAVVSFGEQMPLDAIARAVAAADDCDAVIAAGSTLSVYPAADIPLRAIARSVPYVIVNRGETDHDRLADAVIADDVTSVLPRIVSAIT
jgi:NAD-dependent deacetylase